MCFRAKSNVVSKHMMCSKKVESIGLFLSSKQTTNTKSNCALTENKTTVYWEKKRIKDALRHLSHDTVGNTGNHMLEHKLKVQVQRNLEKQGGEFQHYNSLMFSTSTLLGDLRTGRTFSRSSTYMKSAKLFKRNYASHFYNFCFANPHPDHVHLFSMRKQSMEQYTLYHICITIFVKSYLS